MQFKDKKKILKQITLIMVFLLHGCSGGGVWLPKGEIAVKQYSLILISLMLMLTVVVPVILMTFFFVWKYKNSNSKNIYNPNWNESNIIETIVWFVPIVIILIMAYLSYQSVYDLEPSKPLSYQVKPVKIEVVSLDWKWLFIYPEEHIATINKIVFPINTPLEFTITSNSVMNSFFIPSLGSQIYAMPGMMSKLNLVANVPGIYKGISANYSGIGFSNMKFSAIATKNDKLFYKWIKIVKQSNKTIDNIDQFKLLLKSKENYKVEYFSSINSNIFNKILHNEI